MILSAAIGCFLSSAALEPDGSRTLGIVPPYHAEPAPPPWLRGTSHSLAFLRSRTRHYLYEAYWDGNGGWLVRYLKFPDRGEAVAEAEQAFLFCSDPLAAPRSLMPAEIQFGPRRARWEDLTFVLVDRRDLLKPATRPSPPRP
jgi:hypothetical protein